MSGETKQAVSPTVAFSDEYSVIVSMGYVTEYLNIIDWVNKNSQGKVEVKFENSYGYEKIYFGFSNENDALLFRIRFSEEIENVI